MVYYCLSLRYVPLMNYDLCRLSSTVDISMMSCMLIFSSANCLINHFCTINVDKNCTINSLYFLPSRDGTTPGCLISLHQSSVSPRIWMLLKIVIDQYFVLEQCSSNTPSKHRECCYLWLLFSCRKVDSRLSSLLDQ